MKKRWLIVAVAAVAAVLIAGGAAVYAYDASQADVIADGVTVAGIDVGGMTRGRAEAVLRTRLVPQLRRPVVALFGTKTFVLTPAAAGLRIETQRMVDAAVTRSRNGNLVSRFFREVRGKPLDATLPAQVSVSRRTIAAFAARVKRALDRPARNAKVVPSATSLVTIPSHTGVRIHARAFTHAIIAKLRSAKPPYALRPPAETLQPWISTRKLAVKYPAFILIDRAGKRLRFFRHLKLAKIYLIAVGRIGLETPAGLYHIDDKEIDPSWHVPNSAWAGSLAGRVIPPGPDDPLKARWMGFYDGAGIHGTADIGSLGTAASHGCIRMSIPDVEELFDLVPLHTPVFVA